MPEMKSTDLTANGTSGNGGNGDDVDWIAVDWGTSHVRLWAMAGTRIVARCDSDQGMSRLTPDGYETVLTGLLAGMLEKPPVGGGAVPQQHVSLSGRGPLPVICCGMAGARQGWAEAAYTSVPCPPPGIAQAAIAPCADPLLTVHLLPGVKQNQPADVMRGEETQIAGALAAHPEFDGVICLPGTHTKWAHISANEIVSFRTFMTGEMFALLSGQSVLRHSLSTDGWDDAAFGAAVSHVMGRPAALAADLFALRAESLLHDLPPDAARARLSGLLIGAELVAARPYWLGQPVMVLGEDAISGAYRAALEMQGVPVQQMNSETMTLAGLCAARAMMQR
jgi:2-dehydro-3-deoxygalactonokinase